MQNKGLKKLNALIFPNRCILCGKLCIDEYFCDKCKGKLSPFAVKLCPKCGAPLKYCNCKFYFYYFDKISCSFPNEDYSKECFYRFKFNSDMSAGNYFAEFMSESVKKAFDTDSIDFITYIPMHIIKRLDRGYNQSKYLAKIISKNTKIPFKSIFIQPKKHKTQHKQNDINDRFLNVKGRYKINPAINIKDKTVLIIDDIITTGATLSECARLLKLKGAKTVFCATALKTLYKENNTKTN